ncbi:MAG: HgcAB-associated protein [Halobacteriota archaeon]|nr:HgcAB-associated protein [Halobacteriota archaeon]
MDIGIKVNSLNIKSKYLVFSVYTDISEKFKYYEKLYNTVEIMTEKNTEDNSGCCEVDPTSEGTSCCRLEALVTIDGRGQIILPKDVRVKAGIKAGDKLAVISCESEGKVCCISMIKAGELDDPVKGMLGPMMRGVLK